MFAWTVEEMNLASIFYKETDSRQDLLNALKHFDPNLTEGLFVLDMIYHVVQDLENMSDAQFEAFRRLLMTPAIALDFEEDDVMGKEDPFRAVD